MEAVNPHDHSLRHRYIPQTKLRRSGWIESSISIIKPTTKFKHTHLHSSEALAAAFPTTRRANPTISGPPPPGSPTTPRPDDIQPTMTRNPYPNTHIRHRGLTGRSWSKKCGIPLPVSPPRSTRDSHSSIGWISFSLLWDREAWASAERF